MKINYKTNKLQKKQKKTTKLENELQNIHHILRHLLLSLSEKSFSHRHYFLHLEYYQNSLSE